LVDDEQDSRTRLKHLLLSAGYEVLEACSGQECLHIVQREDVDVVLLDLQMPVMDGFETTQRLRQLRDYATLPIVTMTVADDDELIAKAFDSGANDYVSKPIDRSALLARLKAQLIIQNSQRALRESEDRYALVSRGTNDGIWDWNLKTGDLYLSPRWRTMVGIEDPSWIPRGDEWMELIFRDDRKRVLSELELHLRGEKPHFEVELRMQDSNGGYRWMLCRGLACKDTEGVAYRIAGSLTDITDGKVADALTGLPSRALFQDRIEKCIEMVARKKIGNFAIIYADIDDFKLINDRFGHEAGDIFLIEVARRIEGVLRKSEAVLARLGGDEFGVLLESMDDEEEVIQIAERIHQALMAPFVVTDRNIEARASMGVAIADPNPHSSSGSVLTAEKLLSQADKAMYLAKSQADSPFCIYRSKMLVDSSLHLELASDLRHAIDRGELSLNFQPIVDLKTATTIGYEALVRWQHPEQGNIPPGVFIPIAESKGTIIEIGEWVLSTACHQAMQWQTQFDRELIISVNVSMRQLASRGFVETVVEALSASKLPPKCLKLEVTESLLMQQPRDSLAILYELKDIGATIAIDDFGTGYSSLSYLHQMPLDVLKVDRSFVKGMFDSGKHLAIVRAILALASSLGLKVIAEGVETIEQLQQLQVLGCDMVQGYYFSRPLPAASAAELLGHNWEWPKAEVCNLIFNNGRPIKC